MAEQTIHIDGVDITLFESKRAKSLNITIKPFTGVRVSVPEGVSFKKARNIVEGRIDSVKKHLHRMKKAEDKFTIFDWDSDFATRDHKLQLRRKDEGRLKAIVKDGKIRVSVPDGMDLRSDEVQNEIRKGIERAWRKEAKEYLPERVKGFAKKHNFEFKQVTIQNARTRWGSCSKDNNINLSLHLMRLPDHLIDYVILHELVHTKVKNHKPEFWQLLDQVSGNARKLDREVREYRIQIY